MFIEYIRYAYNNAFRHPKRFLTIIFGVAFSVFGILSLFSITTNMDRMNNHFIRELESGNINYYQLNVQAISMDKPVGKNMMKTEFKGLNSDGLYYYEKFSNYLWNFNYLLPWIKIDDRINLELNPILIDEKTAKEYGVQEKLLFGEYFSNNPNEIILSVDVLNRFIKENDVIHNGQIILPEGKRNALKEGKGERIEPKDIIGKEVSFIYDFEFAALRNDQNNVYYMATNPLAVKLKVVGIYDSGLGYQTEGDAWLPLSLKNHLVGLNSENSIFDSNGGVSGQIAIRTDSLEQTNLLKEQIQDKGYIAKPTAEADEFVHATIAKRKTYKFFYQLTLFITLIISVASLITINALMISERKYEFSLQRALGLSRQKLTILFIIEMFIVSLIGSLFGLLITLLFLQSGLDQLLGFSFYLYGTIAIETVVTLPILIMALGFFQINHSYKSEVLEVLGRGE